MKRIHQYLIALILVILCSSNACIESTYYKVKIHNNTDEPIIVMERIRENDTAVFQPSDMGSWSPFLNLDTIRPNRTGIFRGYLYDVRYHDYYAHYLVWKQSTMDKYSGDEIVRKNIYDERYTFTKDEITSLKVIVEYNGE